MLVVLLIISHNLLIDSLLDFFRGEIQISVVDPLNFKPVLEVAVSTTAELHLQTIDGLFLKTASRHVRVLVETDAVPQTNLKCRDEPWFMSKNVLFYFVSMLPDLTS